MENNRKGGMSETEIEALAKTLAPLLIPHAPICKMFTEEEVLTLRSFLKTKKAASKLVLIVLGTLFLWALKDIYVWVAIHLHWITEATK